MKSPPHGPPPREEDTAVITFVVVRTGRVRVELQVVEAGPCPKLAGGDAGHFAFFIVQKSVVNGKAHEENEYEDDHRWPLRCACGHEFTPASIRRVIHELLLAREDGREWPVRELPPGATFEAWWTAQRGPNGEPWWVVCMPPHGGYDYWEVYSKDDRGRGWDVQGTPPRMSVRQSITIRDTVARLRDGVITKVRM